MTMQVMELSRQPAILTVWMVNALVASLARHLPLTGKQEALQIATRTKMELCTEQPLRRHTTVQPQTEGLCQLK